MSNTTPITHATIELRHADGSTRTIHIDGAENITVQNRPQVSDRDGLRGRLTLAYHGPSASVRFNNQPDADVEPEATDDDQPASRTRAKRSPRSAA